MKMVRKYLFYKRALQVLFAVNIFTSIVGIVAVANYFRTHDLSSLSVALIGLGTLIVGVVAPYLILKQMMNSISEMRKQSEHALARLVAGWVDSYSQVEDEPLKDPQFWLNILLVAVQTFGENTSHPAGQFFAEFAPMMRREMNRPKPKKSSKKSV